MYTYFYHCHEFLVGVGHLFTHVLQGCFIEPEQTYACYNTMNTSEMSQSQKVDKSII